MADHRPRPDPAIIVQSLFRLHPASKALASIQALKPLTSALGLYSICEAVSAIIAYVIFNRLVIHIIDKALSD
jgi:hypothetical protein